ncbi:MAG: acetyltransferase [Chitinophagaceae bacterium]|nr:acetyltransferase [Chitinophagaceae bacterium]
MKKPVVIFGTGEIAELAQYYMQHDSGFEVVAFTADAAFVKEPVFRGKPLVAFEDVERLYSPGVYSMHVALSYSKLNLVRQEKYLAAKAKGYELVSYVCSRSVYWEDLSIGDNCFILENQTIQPTVRIGNNVMIWSGNHLGHGCIIKDHTYLSSHICISGHTEIGERCFVGVNSTFRDFIKVGNRVFVAMGALVTRDIEDDAVILGPKSSVLKAEDEMAVRIRKSYFNI